MDPLIGVNQCRGSVAGNFSGCCRPVGLSSERRFEWSSRQPLTGGMERGGREKAEWTCPGVSRSLVLLT